MYRLRAKVCQVILSKPIYSFLLLKWYCKICGYSGTQNAYFLNKWIEIEKLVALSIAPKYTHRLFRSKCRHEIIYLKTTHQICADTILNSNIKIVRISNKQHWRHTLWEITTVQVGYLYITVNIPILQNMSHYLTSTNGISHISILDWSRCIFICAFVSLFVCVIVCSSYHYNLLSLLPYLPSINCHTLYDQLGVMVWHVFYIETV